MNEPVAGWSARVLGVYCERGFDPSFWAEPLNAITNAAFIVAGALALKRFRGDRPAMALAAVTLAIGLGSFLFHTFATRWSLLADVGPIQLFIALYFFFAMRRFVGLGPFAAACVTAAFVAAASALPEALPKEEPWRGLGGYLGGLLGLVGVGLWLRLRPGPDQGAGLALLAIAALFGVSLAFRTADRHICDAFVIGTHLVWHVLNAVALYTLVATLAKNRRDFTSVRG